MVNNDYFKYLHSNKNFDAETFDNLVVEGLEFEDCNLEMVTFYDAIFENCKFINCNFYGAILVGAEFLNCNFIFSDFSGASLNDANFRQVSFENCSFGVNAFGRGVNISGANLRESHFLMCSFEKAIYNSKTIFPCNFKIPADSIDKGNA